MRILVPVDNSSHSRHVINFLAHRETLLGDKPEIELVNVQYSVPEKVIELFNMTSVRTYYLEEGKKVFDALPSKRCFTAKPAARSPRKPTKRKPTSS